MDHNARLITGVWVLAAVLTALVAATAIFAGAAPTRPSWTELSSAIGDLPVPTGGPQQTDLVVGDFDGDGSEDMVVASRLGTDSVVWYRRSGATWTAETIEPAGLRIEAGGAAHDVDGDGRLDLVFGGDRQSNEIWWWQNPGPAGWGAPWTRFVIKNTGDATHHDLAFGDFDNDGAAELAFWNQGLDRDVNDLYIAEVPADPTVAGEWARFVVFDAAVASEGLAVGDFDADGDDDIAAGGHIIDDAPDGTYTITPFAPGEEEYKLAAGDVIAGGGHEIVSSAGDLVGGLALWTRSGGTWTRTDLLTDATGPLPGPWSHGHSLDIADVDGDGHADVFAAEMHLVAGASARSVVLYGDGLGSFTVDTVSTGIDNHQSLLFDADGDGDVDIASKPFNQATPALRIFRNAYDAAPIGPWTRHQIGDRPSRATWVRHGDLNGDGLDDLVSGDRWHENPGSIDGVWAVHVLPAPLADAQLVVDLDGDGDLDVFGTTGQRTGVFAWAENDGAGAFTAHTNIASGPPDLAQGVTVRAAGASLEIWLAWNDRGHGISVLTVPADPAASLWPIAASTVPSQGEQLHHVDVDGDGDIDVLQGHLWSRNNGDGTHDHFELHSPTRHSFAGSPTEGDRLPDRVVPVDMNADGRLDVVVGHEYDPTNSVAWYEQPADPTQQWTEHIVIEAAFPVHNLDVGDLDGDGDPDLSIAEHDASGNDRGRTMVLQNLSGNGLVWETIVVHDGEEVHDSALLADLDADGDLDIVNIGWHHNRVVVHENRSTTTSAPLWYDADRRYRVDLAVAGPPAEIVDHPVVTGLDLTAALLAAGGTGTPDHTALRVVEVDAAGALLDATVPFQFDPGPDFDAASFATGELVHLLTGATPSGTSRHYQVYFDVVGSGAAPVPVAPVIGTTPGVSDEGLSTIRVDTPTGAWFYDTAGGGFTSLVDAAGNDWIGYNATPGGGGTFRGIPNLVPPADGGHLHPGAGTASSVITHAGALRTTIDTTVGGTGWAMRWEIYPGWARARVVAAPGSYWFQYEGTPGGSLGAAEDSIHLAGQPTIGALSTFGADLADPEWMAAADSVAARQIVVTQDGADGATDSYRDHDDLMTVMAFGRGMNSLIPLFAGTREFTVGLVDGAGRSQAADASQVHAWDPPGTVVRSISTTGTSGPGGAWDGAPPTVPTTPPPAPPPPSAPPAAAALRWSFGNTEPPAGWIWASGDLFDGTLGWVSADGTTRQCGTRNTDPDPVLDTFCHATTRYVNTDGTWNAIASPAIWQTALANGTYDVTVTVGEARSHPSAVAHSVQVEGTTVHDRVSTTTSSPYATATAQVTVADGVLDVTFDGGTKTKIVAIEVVLVTGSVPTTAAPTTPPPTTAAPTPPPTTAPPVTAAPTTAPPAPIPPPDPAAAILQFSFSNTTAPDGWVLATGDLFDGFHGWMPLDGTTRQCGTRNTDPDPVLDTFCHATTRYVNTDGTWNAIASPAIWQTALANGTYDVTVTVGDARANPSAVAHSVQVEGTTVHDRVSTSSSQPHRTASARVTVTDGVLDVTFEGGTKTKIVSLVVLPVDTTTTTAPPTNPPPTSAPTPPPTTAPPTTPAPVPIGATLRWSFSNSAAPAGWALADGSLFDGSLGWIPTDGETRQCGTRNAHPDPVLDTFCHAVTRYSNQGGTWVAIDSPATWAAALADGTYEVLVTVGDATSNPSAIAHSVQVEGVTVHDRTATSRSQPFATATALVVVADGRLDVTFDGGTRTKIIAIEATPVG